MKKLVLIGLVLSSTAVGCGHGWLPFRGAKCRGECIGAAPINNDCQGCVGGYSNYENYPVEQVVDGGIGQPYLGGQVIGQGVPTVNQVPMTGIRP